MTSPVSPAPLPPVAYAAALARLPAMGPGALRRLLAASGPVRAWARVRAGCEEDVKGVWRRAAQACDVRAQWEEMGGAGIGAVWGGDQAFPSGVSRDPAAPVVLFTRGSPGPAARGPRVAVAGTASPTRYGLGVAAQLGAELVGAGVAVVTGLGPGIDEAAHEGACAGVGGAGGAGMPVGVLAGGFDLARPAGPGGLGDRVASCGVLFSATPPGRSSLPWRFPQRNALLAALADVVVVVECHHRSTALHVVRAAAGLGVPVGAVPGSIRSPASAGCNALLADGCFPVRDVADVLVALDLAGADPPRRPRHIETPPAGWAPEPPRARGAVWEALDWEPANLETLLERTGLPLGALCLELDGLVARGLVVEAGGYWERT